jgi:hypothetical protein
MATKAKGKAKPGRAQRKGSSLGRATAKGGGVGRYTPPEESGRYTPPVPKSYRESPRWMGALIVGLFVLGVLIVILNYTDALPGGVSNWWLLAAIASIFGGLMVATRFR